MRTRRKTHITPQKPRWWVQKRQKKPPTETPKLSTNLLTSQSQEAHSPATDPASPEQVPEQPVTQPLQEPASPEPAQTTTPAATQQNQESNETREAGEREKSTSESLKELYTNLKSVPKFGAKIADFLRSYGLHSKNKRISKRLFPRRRVVARFPFDVWQADLIEYPGIKFYNKHFKYVLLVVDVFTKVIYCQPMKRKLGVDCAEAMEKILSQAESPPVMLVTDRGKEFYNNNFQNVMFSNGINHFSTPTLTKFKASVAERAIRTIKTKIDRYMQHTKSKNWIDVIDDIVDGYNHTPHSSHKLAPLDVTRKNQKTVYKRLYPNRNKTVACKLKVGDKVRKLREKSEYEKGYTQNWSDEIYEIVKVRQKHTVCWYKLADSSGDILDGIWYYYQLNLVARHDN